MTPLPNIPPALNALRSKLNTRVYYGKITDSYYRYSWQWWQVFVLQHHHGAYLKTLRSGRPPFMPLLQLIEIIGLPSLSKMLLHGLKQLKPTQVISFDVGDVRIWERGERA
ncbi:hypothetical protein K0M31_006845 [Melipona bicolor]|uniref:Uncharacterized protein n=1 Tax=Melipona bicolor TaxID=60889 RepID=A0AA40FSI6_9HYME|nr:hypothetical protein K0M31_006845 [Melipona bicolor]